MLLIYCRGAGEEEDNNTNNNDDDRNDDQIGDQNNEAPGNPMGHDGDENDPDNAMENYENREGSHNSYRRRCNQETGTNFTNFANHIVYGIHFRAVLRTVRYTPALASIFSQYKCIRYTI